MQDLGVVSGRVASIAYAVNGDGSVVVGSSADSSDNEIGFRWAGTMTSLPLAPYGTYSTAKDVSDDGSIIVGWGDRDIEHRGLVWTDGAVSTRGSIDPLYFNAVRADGAVLGGMLAQSPMIYDSSAVQLGLITGYSRGEVTCLASSGSIRGAGYLRSSTNDRAVRWTNGGDALDLGTLSGSSQALGISADGAVIVGTSGSQAFAWNTNDGMQSLNTILGEAGVSLSGWSLQSATGVSGDGTVIVGYGQHNGVTEAFVVRLP